MTDIEQMARKLCLAQRRDPDQQIPGYRGAVEQGGPMWTIYVPMAKAALS